MAEVTTLSNHLLSGGPSSKYGSPILQQIYWQSWRSKSLKQHHSLPGEMIQFFSSLPGEMIQLDYCNIFQMGWNHQLLEV